MQEPNASHDVDSDNSCLLVMVRYQHSLNTGRVNRKGGTTMGHQLVVDLIIREKAYNVFCTGPIGSTGSAESLGW